MADLDTIEDIGSGLRAKKGELTETESWVYSTPAEDVNFQSNVDRLTVEECDHLLQILTQESKLKAVTKQRIKLVGEDVPEVDTSPGRTLVEPESWDNTGFRERMATILSEAEYPVVNIDDIILPEDENKRGKFQYRRYRQVDNLVESILKHGVLEEITLQGTEDLQYFIIDGDSRFRAWKEAKEEDSTIPNPVFRVLHISDADAAQISVELNRFAQNLDEEDMQALVIRLVEEAGIKQKDIAAQLDLSEGYVSDIVAAFQKVPPEARALIEHRRWKVKTGRHLARLNPYPKDQKRILKNAIKTGYTSSDMDEKVKAALLHHDFEKDITKVMDDFVKPSETPGEALGEVTVSQLEQIHSDLVDKFGKSSSKSRVFTKVLRDGNIEAKPKIATTKRVLKSKGYSIIPDPVKSETSGESETTEKKKPSIPSMPADEILMDDPRKKFLCEFCGGPTHPVISESMGFETDTGYYNSTRNCSPVNHSHCDMIVDIGILTARISDMQKRLVKAQQDLKKEDLSKLMEKQGKTLKDINAEALVYYNAEVEKHQQAWREENLPEPQKVVKKGSKVGEPITEKQKDQLKLLEKVRRKEPKLVPLRYWTIIEKHMQQEEGYKTPSEAAKQVPVARQSFNNQLKKVQKAIAALE